MFKKILLTFILFSIPNIAFSMDDLSHLLETRKVDYNHHSIEVTVPKDFKVDQEALKDSMENAEEYHIDSEKTMKNFISYSLETEFWNSIRNKNEKESILYLFSAVKNGASTLINSFHHALTDIDPKIISIINKSNIEQIHETKILDNVVKILTKSH